MRQLEQLLLPAARPGHGAGEEELQEERLWPSDPGGFLLLVLHRGVSGSQLSYITQYGSRSDEVLFFGCQSIALPAFMPKGE